MLFFLPFFAQAQEDPNIGNQNPNQSNAQVASNANDFPKKKDKAPYCKECEEIKKLKKQQRAERYSSGVSGGKRGNRYFQHFYFRAYQKMKKKFGTHKNKKSDYSCFVW